jgi:hypothetical protein
MPERKVFLAFPCHGTVYFEAVQAAYSACRETPFALYRSEDSRLPHNFNKLWCVALNSRKQHGWTHFAMLHSDVAPERHWLDMLIDEQERLGVDVLAAVIPIKDTRGLTSTGVWNPETGQVRRLTMAEVMQLPETFTASEVADLLQPGLDVRVDMPLLMNSGCFVCRFTTQWPERVVWRFVDEIVRHGDQRFEARTMSEDWDMSRQMAQLGVKVAVTRKVLLVHYGSTGWSNAKAWGDYQEDPGDV